MKKLLSICISAILILGLMPAGLVGATAAEIAAEGTTRLEAEDYTIYKAKLADKTDSTVADSTNFTVTDDETASPSGAGKFIGNKGIPDLNDTGVANGKDYVLQLKIPVSVTTAGIYEITPKVYLGSVRNTSHYEIYVDDSKKTAQTIAGTDGAWKEADPVTVELTADTHTIIIEGTGNFVGGNNNNNYITYAVDYVDVTFIEALSGPSNVEISTTETTRIEAEHHKIYRVKAADKTVRELADVSKFNVADDESASPAGAGKYHGAKAPTELRTPGTTDGQDYVIQLEVPVTVSEAGTYEITPSVFADNTPNVSAYNLYVDGEKKSTQNLGIASGAWTQTTISVDLTADDHIITIEGRGNSVAAHYVVFAVDYIDVALSGASSGPVDPSDPSDPETPPEEDEDSTIVLEAESYTIYKAKLADKTDRAEASTSDFKVRNDENASGGQFKGSKGTKSIGGDYVLQLELPVSIEAEGTYKITPKVYGGTEANSSHYDIYVDGERKSTQSFIGTSGQWSDTDFVLVELTAGDHTIIIEGTGNVVAGNNNNNTSFAVDCVTIEPSVQEIPRVEITSAETKRLEAEDYTLYRVTAADKTVRELADTAKFSVAEDETASPAGAGKYHGAKSPTELRTPGTTDGQNYVLQLEFPITVAEAGTYIITPSVFWDGTAGVSAYNLYVDGEKKSTQNLSIADDVWTQTSVSVDLTADDHTIAIEGRGNAAPAHYVVFAVDYVDIAPEPPAEISKTEPVKLEAEDYKIYKVKLADKSDRTEDTENFIPTVDATASEGMFNGNIGNIAIGYQYVTQLEMIVNVTESGMYTITPSVFWNGERNTSHYDLLVDGVKINTGELTVVAGEWKETSAEISLRQGMHTITVEGTGNFWAGQGNNGNYVCFAVDYVNVEAVEDTTGASAEFTPLGEGLAGTGLKVTYDLGTATKAILRLVYNNEGTWTEHAASKIELASGTTEKTITLPNDSDIVGKEIMVEFVPVDASGKELDIFCWQPEDNGILKRSLEIAPTLIKSGENFTAIVDIDVNTTLDSEEKIYVVLAQYKVTKYGDVIVSESMIPYATDALAGAEGTATIKEPSDSTTIELTLAAHANATEARLFVWTGTGLSDAGASTHYDVTVCPK